MSDFGSAFRKAREAKGLSLDVIANDTRIGKRFLVAIEREEFHLLPGGIFNRGFIRTYAQRIGLDAERVLAKYDELSQAVDPEPPEQFLPPAASPKVRRLYPIAVGVIVLLIVLLYAVTRGQDAPVNSTAAPASPVSTPARPPASSRPAPAFTPPAPEDAPPPASPPQVTPMPLVVELEAQEATWIRVATDGLFVVEGEVLEPGTTRRYTAQESIGLTIGNAGGLTLRVNEREVRSLGRSGQVREFVITPNNLDDITG